MRKITMKDIADRVGVSKMTVSKFFNGNGDISEEMRGKIAIAAEELGYRYSTGKLFKILVLVPEIFLNSTENFYTSIYKDLSTQAALKNIVLSLMVVSKDDEKSLHVSVQLTENFDGIIVLGQLRKEYVKQLKEVNKPTVLTDFQYRDVGFDSVVGNNFQSSYEITSYLIDNNHVNIAFLGNIRTTISIKDRFLGYYKALLEYDLEYDENNIFNNEEEVIERFIADADNRTITAIVCNNDHVAYILVEKLKALGLGVPNDVSITGFDDVIYSQISMPALTTVAVKRKKMAQETIDLLLRRAKKPKVEKSVIVVAGEIIYRDSVKKL